MGRPKGVKNKEAVTQGVESATEKVEITEVVNSEVTTVVNTKEATVVEVKVKAPKIKELQMGGAYLANVNGEDIYWSKALLDSAHKRNSHTILMPKGSNYIPPVNSNCENCG
jgi:hypothetical protein